jgi:hypothetical protein
VGMRYGALPIVRRTGGLGDTVHDLDDPRGQTANGFAFDGASDGPVSCFPFAWVGVDCDRVSSSEVEQIPTWMRVSALKRRTNSTHVHLPPGGVQAGGRVHTSSRVAPSVGRH